MEINTTCKQGDFIFILYQSKDISSEINKILFTKNKKEEIQTPSLNRLWCSVRECSHNSELTMKTDVSEIFVSISIFGQLYEYSWFANESIRKLVRIWETFLMGRSITRNHIYVKKMYLNSVLEMNNFSIFYCLVKLAVLKNPLVHFWWKVFLVLWLSNSAFITRLGRLKSIQKSVMLIVTLSARR